jgi:hypothetical protein
MLDAKYLRVVHVARKALKLTDEDYRAILFRVCQIGSAAQLDEIGFHDLMAEFERLGFRSTWKRQTGGYRAGMATPSQIGMMAALWKDYRGEDDQDGFRHWLERFHKVSDARFVTARKANAVLTALKNMVRRKRAA